MKGLRLLGREDLPALHMDPTKSDSWSLNRIHTKDENYLEIKNGDKAVAQTEKVDYAITGFALPPVKKPEVVAWGQMNRLILSDIAGKRIHECYPAKNFIQSIAFAADAKHFAAATDEQLIGVYSVKVPFRQLSLCISGDDWIIWATGREPYYAASPGGEQLLGFTVNNGLDKLATFHPASRFRDHLYRPDIIKMIMEKDSHPEAIAAANQILKKKPESVEIKTLLPPTVNLISVDDSKLPQVTVKAAALATDAKQSISSLELLINARPVLGDAGVQKTSPPRAEASGEWTFTLTPGTHQISVRACAGDRWGASDEATLTFSPGQPMQQLPTLHALLIGVNYKNTPLQLNFSDNDAIELERIFKQRCGQPVFGKVNTVVLTEDKEIKPTAANILAEIAKFKKAGTVGRDDLLVVFFSGHGTKDETDGQLYLLTTGVKMNDLKGTCLSGDVLKQTLAEVPCQVMLMLDACHSNQILATQQGGDGRAVAEAAR